MRIAIEVTRITTTTFNKVDDGGDDVTIKAVNNGAAGCSTTTTKKKNSTKRSTKVKYQFIECDISKGNRKLHNGIECFGTVIGDSEKLKVVQKFSFCAARRITCDLVIGDPQPNLTLGKASI
ncbi:unnamed protein product [Macrosiphum euphorbiae]|uniref:Uncharacterized protein n=1 Tax=Macrosiphum euphorbiae TaxID=13131 RepID=A0AAV0Y340_9HEMI|nr:unnamed protein product [Macrosiphum euphorbiae]CAI6374437.1 unnamed protein product [Macrosiphum euphorbiae]CAI6374444.1 unnamed protein product [Macrosiphum euphorbiae]